MRMKKWFALFLVLILCLSACPSLAEVVSEVSDAGSIDWDTTDVYLNMRSTCLCRWTGLCDETRLEPRYSTSAAAGFLA